MTFPPIVRVFFAIDLPAATREQLTVFMNRVKRMAKPHAIRWTKPENLHITLQFLPEVHSQDLPSLIANVREQLAIDINQLMITFGALQLFPHPFRPRVLVLDVAPQATLSGLSSLVGKGVAASQLPVEDRPFRAHLTLGRIKQPQGLDLKFISQFATPPAVDPFGVKDIVLFRSEPQPEGSHYSVLERIDLNIKAKAS